MIEEKPPHLKPFWWTDKSAQLSQRLGHVHSYSEYNSSKHKPLSWINYDTFSQKEKQNIEFVNTVPTTSSVKTSKPVTKRSTNGAKENEVEAVIKLPIAPNTEQKTILRGMFGICRTVWNDAADLINKGKYCTSWTKLKQHLVTPNETNLEDQTNRPWRYDHKLCPYDTKAAAVFQIFTSYQTAIRALEEAGKEELPVMHFKSKKDKRDSIAFPIYGADPWTSEVSEQQVRFRTKVIAEPIVIKKSRRSQEEVRKVMNILLKQNEEVFEKTNQNPNCVKCHRQVTLLWEYPDNWSLCFNYAKPKKIYPQDEEPRVIALDPGVRTFQTGFGTDGIYSEFGKDGIKKIAPILHRCDKIVSRLKKEEKVLTSRKKRRMERALQKRRNRAHNLVTDVHWKLAKHLTTLYDKVIIPKFQSSKMIRKETRNIGKKTVRSLLAWRHYEFRQKLKYKAQVSGCKIYEVTEEWTSKCCSACGIINHKLGSNKVFKCGSCGWTIDRDRNGARNILIKNILSCDCSESGRRASA